jgi:hypothetical protein
MIKSIVREMLEELFRILMKDKDKEKSRRFKHLLTLTKSSNVLYVSEKSKMQFFAHLVPNLAAKIA